MGISSKIEPARARKLEGMLENITLGTLKGTYVTGSSVGYVTDPSTGNLIPITSAGVETFFGNGHASGVVTVALPGQVFQRIPFTATYTVNGDGSVSETTFGPETDTFDLYPTPDGSTIAQIQTNASPAGTTNFPLRSGVLTRSSGQALQNQQ